VYCVFKKIIYGDSKSPKYLTGGLVAFFFITLVVLTKKNKNINAEL